MDNNLSQSDHSKQPWIELSGAHATIGLGLANRFSSSAKGFVTIFYNQSGKPAPGPVPPSLYDLTEEDDMEIMTTAPGTKFKAELHPSFNIAFREIEGLEREPVAAVLHQMRQLVERILPTFALLLVTDDPRALACRPLGLFPFSLHRPRSLVRRPPMERERRSFVGPTWTFFINSTNQTGGGSLP
jgi:hypothetical protein